MSVACSMKVTETPMNMKRHCTNCDKSKQHLAKLSIGLRPKHLHLLERSTTLLKMTESQPQCKKTTTVRERFLEHSEFSSSEVEVFCVLSFNMFKCFAPLDFLQQKSTEFQNSTCGHVSSARRVNDKLTKKKTFLTSSQREKLSCSQVYVRRPNRKERNTRIKDSRNEPFLPRT